MGESKEHPVSRSGIILHTPSKNFATITMVAGPLHSLQSMLQQTRVGSRRNVHRITTVSVKTTTDDDDDGSSSSQFDTLVYQLTTNKTTRLKLGFYHHENTPGTNDVFDSRPSGGGSRGNLRQLCTAIKNCTSLQQVSVSNRTIPDANNLKIILSAIAQSSSSVDCLKVMLINGTPLPRATWKQICHTNHTLSTLELSGSSMFDLIPSKQMSLLHGLKNLSTLKLVGCGLGDDHVCRLCQLFLSQRKKDKPLEQLSLARNTKISPQGYEILADHALNTIKRFDLSDCGLDASDVQPITRSFKLQYREQLKKEKVVTFNLRELVLSGNYFLGTSPCVVELARAGLNIFRRLDLSDCNQSYEQIMAIMQLVLHRRCTMDSVVLNQPDDDGNENVEVFRPFSDFTPVQKTPRQPSRGALPSLSSRSLGGAGSSSRGLRGSSFGVN